MYCTYIIIMCIHDLRTYVQYVLCVCTHIRILYAQGYEDVAHLKDEVATQQGKMDKLKTELAILEQAENSLKVGQHFSATESWREEDMWLYICFLLSLLHFLYVSEG